MTQPPPIQYAAPLPNNIDAEHLRLLSIFHYVLAGLNALFGCFPLIYVLLGTLFVAGAIPMQNSGGGPPAAAMGIIFIVMGLVISCFAWTIAILLFLSARNMGARRRRVFSIVVAAISCAFMPLGTILGVFTLVVLLRPSVKVMYGE